MDLMFYVYKWRPVDLDLLYGIMAFSFKNWEKYFKTLLLYPHHIFLNDNQMLLSATQKIFTPSCPVDPALRYIFVISIHSTVKVRASFRYFLVPSLQYFSMLHQRIFDANAVIQKHILSYCEHVEMIGS